MPRRSADEDDYDYDDDQEAVRRARFNRREEQPREKQKSWDRENVYDRYGDHDDRR